MPSLKSKFWRRSKNFCAYSSSNSTTSPPTTSTRPTCTSSARESWQKETRRRRTVWTRLRSLVCCSSECPCRMCNFRTTPIPCWYIVLSRQHAQCYSWKSAEKSSPPSSTLTLRSHSWEWPMRLKERFQRRIEQEIYQWPEDMKSMLWLRNLLNSTRYLTHGIVALTSWRPSRNYHSAWQQLHRSRSSKPWISSRTRFLVLESTQLALPEIHSEITGSLIHWLTSNI